MGSQPTPPSPADIQAQAGSLATAQQGYNAGAQAGSQYNQTDPYGSLSYAQTGVGPNGVPTYTASTSYSPVQQGLYNSLTGTQTEAGNQAASTLGFGNYGTISPAQQIGNETSGLTGQVLNNETNYLDPFFQTQSQQLDTQLKNEGLQPGNPAYDNATRSLDTNQGLTVSNFLGNYEPQAFSQATTLYGLPASTAENLAQFGSPTSPTGQFTQNTPALQPASIQSADQTVGSQEESQYQGQQAQYNAMIQGLFGIGSAALGGLTGGLSSSSPFTSILNSLPGSASYGNPGSAANPLPGLTAADY